MPITHHVIKTISDEDKVCEDIENVQECKHIEFAV